MKIISTAPTRISIFGGGTDLPVYSEQYGGVCINMAINLRQKIELDDSTSNIELLSEDSRMFFSVFLQEMLPIGFSHKFDAPIESGLGSSASLAVALIGAINKAKNLGMTKEEIAEKAWDIEVNKLGLYGGRQDQYASVWGRTNLWHFNKKVERIEFTREVAEELAKYILLFHTGENRKDPRIQEELKILTKQQTEALHGVKTVALEAKEPIALRNWNKVGDLLDRAWTFKMMSNKKMTTKKIDELYEVAMKAGAWGGKLLGSGGGGHMIFMADKPLHTNLIEKLWENGAKHIDYSIDWNGLETRIV